MVALDTYLEGHKSWYMELRNWIGAAVGTRMIPVLRWGRLVAETPHFWHILLFNLTTRNTIFWTCFFNIFYLPFFSVDFGLACQKRFGKWSDSSVSPPASLSDNVNDLSVCRLSEWINLLINIRLNHICFSLPLNKRALQMIQSFSKNLVPSCLTFPTFLINTFGRNSWY